MTEPSHLELAKDFIHASGYADDKRVRAIYLVGSSATGDEDAYSDADMMIVTEEMIGAKERLERLQDLGCENIMLAIAGVDNPALPVESQVIDKFVFRDTYFDLSFHLPHQLEFCFDYVTLVDKEDLTPELCAIGEAGTKGDLKTRVQANLRLLHVRIYRYVKYVRRSEWIGLDLSAIKNAIVDVVMVLNDQPNYNRHSSHISEQLAALPTKPPRFEARMADILHLDDREHWERKLELMRQMESELTELAEAKFGPIAMFDGEATDG